MVLSFTSTSREARWLHKQLRSLDPPLPVFRDQGRGNDRYVLYTRQGGADIANLAGTYLVRSAWLVYVNQPVPNGSMVYVEDLEEDADRVNAAIYKPEEPEAVHGRYIEECRRDVEHAVPVYDETTLTDVQLGAIYVIYTSLA